MTNQALPPPFIADPPFYNSFFDMENVTISVNGNPINSNELKISNSWSNWLNSVTKVMGRVIVHDYLIIGGVRATEVPTLLLPNMTTTERNQLDNARDGIAIYNTTTGRVNFREGGTWVTFAPVPA